MMTSLWFFMRLQAFYAFAKAANIAIVKMERRLRAKAGKLNGQLPAFVVKIELALNLAI
jgi:hypothetical protein